MRRQIADAKGESDPWDLKQAAGGIVDIEFIAQGLQLVHAAKHPAVLATGTRDALCNLRDAGAMTVEDSGSVGAILGALQPRSARSFAFALASQFRTRNSARCLENACWLASAGLPDFTVLQAEIAEDEYVVRRIFRKVIDGTQIEH